MVMELSSSGVMGLLVAIAHTGDSLALAGVEGFGFMVTGGLALQAASDWRPQTLNSAEPPQPKP